MKKAGTLYAGTIFLCAFQVFSHFHCKCYWFCTFWYFFFTTSAKTFTAALCSVCQQFPSNPFCLLWFFCSSAFSRLSASLCAVEPPWSADWLFSRLWVFVCSVASVIDHRWWRSTLFDQCEIRPFWLHTHTLVRTSAEMVRHFHRLDFLFTSCVLVSIFVFNICARKYPKKHSWMIPNTKATGSERRQQ